MEKYQAHREQAKKRLHTADHILTQTYPLVKDPKLLLAVLQNLYTSLDEALSCILEHEKYYKRLPAYHSSFPQKLQVFKTRLAERLGIKNDAIQVIERVYAKISQHKDSPVEFSRKDMFVICDKKYNMETLSVSDLKSSIQTSKSFMKKIDELTSKNERILDKLKTGNK